MSHALIKERRQLWNRHSGLAVLNVGNNTYRNPNYTQTIPGISYPTEGLSTKVCARGHYSKRLSIYLDCRYKLEPKAWNLNKLEQERFIQVLRNGQEAIQEQNHDLGNKDESEELVYKVMTLLRKACVKSMHKKGLHDSIIGDVYLEKVKEPMEIMMEWRILIILKANSKLEKDKSWTSCPPDLLEK